MESIAMWKATAIIVIKTVPFLCMVLYLLAPPLMGSVTDVYGDTTALDTLVSLLTKFLPCLAVNAALVGFFPSWRFQRVALPALAAMTLIVWAWLALRIVLACSAKYPNVPIRWPFLALTPLAIVVAAAFVFLLARARHLAVARS